MKIKNLFGDYFYRSAVLSEELYWELIFILNSSSLFYLLSIENNGRFWEERNSWRKFSMVKICFPGLERRQLRVYLYVNSTRTDGNSSSQATPFPILPEISK